MSQSPRQGISLARVGRSAAVLGSAAIVAQILTLVRELYLAANVGISAQFDALLVGVALPMQLATVLRGGAVRALVPAYVEAKLTHGPVGARTLAGVIMLWIGLGGLLLAIVLSAAAPRIIEVTGPGLSAAEKASAAGYLQMLAPVAFVSSITGVLFAVLQAEEAFAGMAVGTIVEPLATLTILLVFWGSQGLTALALGSLVGPVVSLVVALTVAARKRALPRLRFWARGLGLPAFVRHAFPITVSLGLLQVNSIVDSAIATLIGPGAVSALRYGGTLFRAPISALNAAWGTAIYPALVQASHGEGESGLARATDRTVRFVIAAFVPVALLTAMVAPLAVSTVYNRGQFTEQDLQITSLVLAAFSPLVFLMMVSSVLTSALNARRKGMVLLAASFIDIASHVTFGFGLGWLLGVVGVALASSITTMLTAAFFTFRLARIEQDFHIRPLMEHLGRSILASLPAGLLVGVLCWNGFYLEGLIGGLVSLAVYGIIGIAGFLAVSVRVGVPESQILASTVAARVRRRRAVAV